MGQSIVLKTLDQCNVLNLSVTCRPSDEEPHVKKTMKGKTEKIELICRSFLPTFLHTQIPTLVYTKPTYLPACMPTYLSELYMMSIWRLMIDLSGSTRRSLATWRTNMKTWKLFSKCLTLTRSPQSQIASFVTTCVFSSGRSGELEGGLRHATLCRIWPSCEHSLTILCLCRYWELN